MYGYTTGGVERTKPTPNLFNVNIDNFQREIDWIRTHVKREFGITVARAALDPYIERWHLYSDTGTYVVSIPHDVVETLYGYFLLRTKHGKAKKLRTEG